MIAYSFVYPNFTILNILLITKRVIKTSEFIRSGGFENYQTFILKKNYVISLLNASAYPQGKIPIKKKKLEDIQKVMPYIIEEHKEFFNECLSGQ